MNPIASWAIFVTVIGVAYFATWNSGKKHQGKRFGFSFEKPKFLISNNSPLEAFESKKKPQPKKKKVKKPVVKDVLSTSNGENPSDDGEAREVAPADVAKRLQAMKQGIKPSASRSVSRQANLAPSSGPAYAASQTSSTGADADIDEEEHGGSDYPSLPKSSSSDPSDMIDTPTTGPGVLRIGSPVQPPRPQKKRIVSSSSDTGLHAAKNAKKKEKKKAERDAQRAEQQARFEQHRKAMKSEEAAQQKNKPQLSQPSVWASANGKKASNSDLSPTIPESPSTELLDTFVPHGQTAAQNSSHKILKSTTLSDSWEAIPHGAMAPVYEWNEVKSKKTRKDKKGDDFEATKSADEYKPKSAVIPPEPVKAPKPIEKKEPKKINSTVSKSIREISVSDWAEVDNLDNWIVHPESSEF